MIESVVALLMFVNAEIKEARLQVDGMAQCLRGKREAERTFSRLARVVSIHRFIVSITIIASGFWFCKITEYCNSG